MSLASLGNEVVSNTIGLAKIFVAASADFCRDEVAVDQRLQHPSGVAMTMEYSFSLLGEFRTRQYQGEEVSIWPDAQKVKS